MEEALLILHAKNKTIALPAVLKQIKSLMSECQKFLKITKKQPETFVKQLNEIFMKEIMIPLSRILKITVQAIHLHPLYKSVLTCLIQS